MSSAVTRLLFALLLAANLLRPAWAQEAEAPLAEAKPADVEAPAKADGALRVLQFNIWQEGTSVEGGFDKVVDVIFASNADVIVLSEVRNYNDKDLHGRLIAALAEKGATYQGRFAGGDVGLLTRWQIEKAEAAADDTATDRGSVMAYHLLGLEGLKLVVCPAHLDYRNYAVYLPRGYDGNSFKMIDKDEDGEPDPVTKESALHRMDKASARDEAHEAFLGYIKKQKLTRTPVLYVGDFNECSHLDWTRATKDLYSHNGVVIEWKHSKMLYQAGFRDAWRELYPDPVTHPGATWPSEAFGRGSTSWAPKVDERDRIDFIYHNGRNIRATAAWIVGSNKYYVYNELAAAKTDDPFALTDLPWPSDHKGVMVDFVFDKKSR